MVPGEYKLQPDKVPYNVGYDDISLKVKNVGDRPVQVGSEYHFLRCKRARSTILIVVRHGGKHLDIPAGNCYSSRKLVKSGPLAH